MLEHVLLTTISSVRLREYITTFGHTRENAVSWQTSCFRALSENVSSCKQLPAWLHVLPRRIGSLP